MKVWLFEAEEVRVWLVSGMETLEARREGMVDGIETDAAKWQWR